MIVGITRLTLAIPGAVSLKEKRSVVKKALDRVRARYNIAAAEVDAQEALQRAVLGFATVGSDATRIRAILEKVVSFVENTGLAQVMAAETETATYGEGLGEDALQSYAEKFGVDESWPPRVDVPATPGAGPGDAGPGNAGPGNAGPGNAGPGGAEAGGAGTGEGGGGRRVAIRPGSLGFGSRGDPEDEE